MSKLLVLGGTNFIGRRLVEKLMNNSEFELTLFNRGKTNNSLFPNCRKIIGDRENNQDLEQLFLESWDYVIDLSCYFPSSLKIITEKINPDINKYIFISTCSVYDNEAYEGMCRNEHAPLLKCNKEEEKDSSLDTYGKRKAACEAILIASKLKSIILRPSLVYGPYDITDRLYYWIYATNFDQEFILPENGKRLFSITYVDDLVNCIFQLIGSSICNKVYNCISHPSISIAKIVATSSAILKQELNTVSMDANFLKNENISEWFDLPLWLSTDKFTFSNRALEKDIDFKPINFKISMQQTIDYYHKKSFSIPRYGIDNKQQSTLIKKFKTNG